MNIKKNDTWIIVLSGKDKGQKKEGPRGYARCR